MAVQFLADPGYVVPLPPPPPRAPFRPGAFLVRMTFTAGAFGLVAALFFLAYHEFSYVTSLRATAMGDIVQFKAPEAGAIAAVRVRDGQEVAPGDPLFEMDAAPHRQRVARLGQVCDRLREQVEAAQAQIDEERRRSKLHGELSSMRLKLLHAERESLNAQVRLTRKNQQRVATLRASRSISQHELDVAETEVAERLAQLEVKLGEIAMQEVVIRHAGDNWLVGGHDRSFAGFTLRNDIAPARAELARMRAELEEARGQVAEGEALAARCVVTCRVAGRVYHVSRLAGDYVTSNDYVLSVCDRATRPYVAARFTSEDAKYLQQGAACTVTLPARMTSAVGEVVSIGHSGLSASGAVSIDEETSLSEVPVKITLPDGVEFRGGEGAYVKVRRNWSVAVWLQKLL